MASIDDIVNVGNSTNKNISQLIVAINSFASLYSASAYKSPITVTTAAATIDSTQSWVIVNYAGTSTLTLPSAVSFPGRVITIKTVTANGVNSASSNITPINGTGTTSTILTAVQGRSATLVSNGTTWVIMQANFTS